MDDVNNESWQEVPIGSLCLDIFDGPHATPKKTTDGPVFLGIANLRDGRIDLSTVEHLSERDFLTWTRRVTPQRGDIVFSYETRLGEAAMIPEGLKCCLGRRMALMRPDTSVVDPRFLLYAYLAPFFQDVIRARTIHGSTVDRIPLTDFPRFPIRVPDLSTQRAISHILGTLDDKIELNRRMSRTLEEMARALFRSWFVDFDPVRAKAAGRQPEGMDAATGALFPCRLLVSELGETPEGWQIEELGNWLEVIETGSRPKGGTKGIDEGVPSIGAESITRIGEFDFSKTKFIPSDFFANMRRGVVTDKDVLLYKDGGRPGEFEPHVSMFGSDYPFDQFAINEHVYRLRAKSPLTQSYLYFWLRAPNNTYARRGSR